MNLLAESIAAAWPIEAWRDCHVVVAVSGGADSVALLLEMLELRRTSGGSGEVLAAHFNHRLRGEESDGDEAWVSELCETLGVSLTIGQASQSEPSASEAAARQVRYDFLLATAEAAGARYVATAHTASDQAETVLMRALRGTGIAGLAGIPFARPLSPSVTLVRPLLHVGRQQIEDCLVSRGQDFRTDSTNRESKFTRNWIRHELLPLLRERFPADVDASLLRLARQADDWQRTIRELVDPLLEQHVQIEPGKSIAFDRGPLALLPDMLRQELCRAAWRGAHFPEQSMGHAEWTKLAAAFKQHGPAFGLPESVHVGGDDAQVVLTRDVKC